MEKIYKKIIYVFALCLTIASCKEEIEIGLPSDGQLRLSAQKEKAISRAAAENGFEEGTRFRIWAYLNNVTAEKFPKNGVTGTETALTGGMHYIDLGDYNQYLPGEKDFYGFTDNTSSGDCTPNTDNSVYNINFDDSSPAGYTDFLRAHLPYSDRGPSNILTMNFRHIMSKVTFKVVQQSEENVVENNRLQVTSISLKQKGENGKIPQNGTYDVLTGQFSITESAERKITPEKEVVVPVCKPEENKSAAQVGEPFLIFPSRAGLNSKETTPQYVASITFKDPTGSYGAKDEEITQEIDIYDSWSQENVTLEFLPNHEYTLSIQFLGDGNKRIITVVPLVYDWLEGEGVEDNTGYQEQSLGQPVTFNGVMWADRNLGATGSQPTHSYNDWLKSVGYFYQYGRNIPYFPMPWNSDEKPKYIDNTTDLGDPEQLAKSLVTNKTTGVNPLYPVINPQSWNLNDQTTYYYRPSNTINWQKCIWNLGDVGDGNTFSFDYNTNYTLGKLERKSLNLDASPNTWQDQSETPCPPGWRLPTAEDFRGILPGSAYSGNITFRNYSGYEPETGSWLAEINGSLTQEPQFKEVFAAENLSKVIVKKGAGIGDEGQQAYRGGFPYLYRREEEKFGDRIDHSVYILSMGDGDWTRVKDQSGDLSGDKGDDYVYNWGKVYGIKRQGTDNAYRVKWEIKLVSDGDFTKEKGENELPDIKVYTQPFRGVLVISRYPADKDDDFEADDQGQYRTSLRSYDWEHPAEVLYLPVGGIAGNWSEGKIANVGTETWYATCEKDRDNPRKTIMWFKFAGTRTSSQSIILSDKSPLGDAVQIRCVRDLNAH